MIIPTKLVRHILGGVAVREARMAVHAFGTPMNQCAVVLANEAALTQWSNWFQLAAEQLKAKGDEEQLEALRGFWRELLQAVVAARGIS
jgi:hypothetical protein